MAKKGPRDIRRKTIPNLQATLWPIMALYIKQNHSHDGEWCTCITCGKAIQIGSIDCQAGHFIPRSYSPTKYEEDNLRPQCARCNGASSQGHFAKYSGRPIEFERALRLEIGDERVDELKMMSTELWKWDRFYLIDKIEYYKEQLN